MGIVFHDVEPYPGTRLIDSLRRFDQVCTMRRMLGLADLTVFTVPPERLSWLTAVPSNAVFRPCGCQPADSRCAPTCSLQEQRAYYWRLQHHRRRIRSPRNPNHSGRKSLCRAEAWKVRLSVFGRHAELRETELREGLRDLPVELSVEGVLERCRSHSEAFRPATFFSLFAATSLRAAAAPLLALLAASRLLHIQAPKPPRPLPMLAWSLSRPTTLMILMPLWFESSLIATYRMDLASRSRAAYKTHFAWAAISARFSALLKDQKVSSNGR